MIPRSAPRRIILAFCLAFIATALISSVHSKNALPTHRASLGITKGYCASDLSGPIVYVSDIFDAVIKARTQISTQPLNNAFYNYLVETYDYKKSGNYPTGCALFETLGQAEGRRSQLLSEARAANKRVVEVNWNPGPLDEVPQGDGAAVGPKGPPPTHTICAVGHQTTMYFSAVFDTAGWQPNPKWNDAFNDFLRKTYSAEGEANCTSMNTRREADQLLKDRVAGVRANNHKAVETGWRYNASLAAVKPAAKPTPKVDDDPEPAPRPAAPKAPPSQSIKEFAAKEGPLVLDYCQKDPMLKKIFDCYRVQRSVYNYRMEHGSNEPLATLFTEEKVNLAEAISTGAGQWVRDRATAQGLDNRVTNCIEQKFNVSFYERPYISQMQKIYDASVASCK